MTECIIGAGGSEQAWETLCLALHRRGITDLQFVKNNYGKPMLATGELHFNISHSHGRFAVALSDEPVGVDIEQVRVAPHGVAKRFFTRREAESIATDDDFFTVWTAKESYIKYLGTGLKTPLSSFDVQTVPCFFTHRREGQYHVCLCTAQQEDVVWTVSP